MDRIFWKDLGVRDPGSVVLVMSAEAGAYDPRRVISVPDFEDLRGMQTCFRDLSGSAFIYPAVDNRTTTEIQPGEAVDGKYFGLFGVKAAIGRLIQPADDYAASPVVVLGHILWQTRFAGRADIVGQTVRLSGRPFEIIGVAPRSFEGPVAGGPRGSRLWIPLGAARSLELGNPASATPERERRRLAAIGRLKSGRTIRQATTELAALAARLDAAYPRTRSAKPGMQARRGWRARGLSEASSEADLMRRFGLIVVGLVALVLVVACTNLANLVLARGTMRQHELAVRCALGASRWRLVREQLAESLVLAVGGGVLSGVVIAFLTWALDVEVPMAQGWLVSVRPEIHATTLVVAAGASLLSLVVFGLEPALKLTARKTVREDLEAGAGSVAVPRAKRQRALLRWQVAVSTAFFIIASLCVRYLVTEARHDSGVDMDRMGVMSIDFYVQRWDEARTRRVLPRLIEMAGREPGIQAVAASTGMPFGTTMSPRLQMARGDESFTDPSKLEGATLIEATPRFFRAAGISILRGRAFDDRDDRSSQPVVILSESTAKTMFGTAGAVGRQLRVKVDTLGLPPEQPVKTVTVVGVAEDTDTTFFFLRRGGTAYVPFAQEYYPFVTVVARASDPAMAVRALRTAARKADPDLAIAQAASGRAMLSGMYLFLRGMGVAALALGALTLMLAMIGLYGVQSHIVAHRTREIGVRMSFGATAGQIKRMVLSDGYRPVLQGLAIGLFIGTAGRVIVRSVVVAPIDVVDPWMLAMVPVPLVLAAFCACYLPARRASTIDPNVALRHL